MPDHAHTVAKCELLNLRRSHILCFTCMAVHLIQTALTMQNNPQKFGRSVDGISVEENPSFTGVSVSLYSWGWILALGFSSVFTWAGWKLMTEPQPLKGGGQSSWASGLLPLLGGLWLAGVGLMWLAGRTGVRNDNGRCLSWTSIGPIRWWRSFSADDFRELEFYWTGKRKRTPAARIHTHSGKRISVTMPDDKHLARRYFGAVRKVLGGTAGVRSCDSTVPSAVGTADT
jgi:hypothetical protein